MNDPNNGVAAKVAQAEGREGRRAAKKNIEVFPASRTQSRTRASMGLDGVGEAARAAKAAGKEVRFTALLHHITPQLQRESFMQLKRNAAAGADGVKWREYEEGLDERIGELWDAVHAGRYRALPSRRVYIPKAGGKHRPLGIAALGDKIVQQAVVTVLTQIYEANVLGFSYGFRRGRNQHQALDAVVVGMQTKRVNWMDLVRLLDELRSTISVKHSANQLAQKIAMSRRTFNRRFLSLTGCSLGEWLLAERLRMAQVLLETTKISLERIAEQTGFGSTISFRQHFEREFGMPPSTYRQQYCGN